MYHQLPLSLTGSLTTRLRIDTCVQVLASKHGRADVVTALLERGAQIDRYAALYTCGAVAGTIEIAW